MALFCNPGARLLCSPRLSLQKLPRAVDEGVVGDRVVAAVRLGVDVVDLPQAQFWWVSFTAGGGKKGGSCYTFGMQVGGCHVDLRVMAKAKSLAPLRLRPPVLSDKFPYLVGRRAAEGALQRPSKLAHERFFHRVAANLLCLVYPRARAACGAGMLLCLLVAATTSALQLPQGRSNVGRRTALGLASVVVTAPALPSFAASPTDLQVATPRTVPFVLIGAGGVGSALLRTITDSRVFHADRYGIRLSALAVCDSSAAVLATTGAGSELSDKALAALIAHKAAGGKLATLRGVSVQSPREQPAEAFLLSLVERYAAEAPEAIIIDCSASSRDCPRARARRTPPARRERQQEALRGLVHGQLPEPRTQPKQPRPSALRGHRWRGTACGGYALALTLTSS